MLKRNKAAHEGEFAGSRLAGEVFGRWEKQEPKESTIEKKANAKALKISKANANADDLEETDDSSRDQTVVEDEAVYGLSADNTLEDILNDRVTNKEAQVHHKTEKQVKGVKDEKEVEDPIRYLK